MRIVYNEEFLKLPAGTVYASYTSLGMVGNLAIKGNSIHDLDFFYHYVTPEVDAKDSNEFVYWWDKAEKDSRIEIPTEHVGERDGMFDKNMRYVIFTLNEVKAIISELQKVT